MPIDHAHAEFTAAKIASGTEVIPSEDLRALAEAYLEARADKAVPQPQADLPPAAETPPPARPQRVGSGYQPGRATANLKGQAWVQIPGLVEMVTEKGIKYRTLQPGRPSKTLWVSRKIAQLGNEVTKTDADLSFRQWWCEQEGLM